MYYFRAWGLDVLTPGGHWQPSSRPLRSLCVLYFRPPSPQLSQDLRAAYNSRSLYLAQVLSKGFWASNFIIFSRENFAFLFFKASNFCWSNIKGGLKWGCRRNYCINFVSYFQQQLPPLVLVKALSRHLLSSAQGLSSPSDSCVKAPGSSQQVTLVGPQCFWSRFLSVKAYSKTLWYIFVLSAHFLILPKPIF